MAEVKSFPSLERLQELLSAGNRGRTPLPRTAVAPLSVPPLHNHQKAKVEIVEETPVHRAMCLLRCEGFSAREIADRLGYSAAHVTTVLKQEWAQKIILETIHAMSQEGLERIYKKYEAEALDVAHAIMTDPETPLKLQKECAVDILKIARGQRITIEDNRKSLTELAQEEEVINAKLNALTAPTPNVTGTS